MNDAQNAVQIAAAAGAGGKAASAATAAKYTALGLFAGAITCAAVVMAATTPERKRDVFVCLVSTLLLSVCGGAVASIKLGLVDGVVAAAGGDYANLVTAVLSLILAAFMCGLPAWCMIGGYFVWVERMRGKTIVEIVDEARRIWK